MRVLVCGSRTWEDRKPIYALLCGIADGVGLHVIEGGARGADRIAGDFATGSVGVGHEQYPADWDRYGKAAGAIRNQQMLDEGKPDLVLAFSETDECGLTRGTQNMVDQAKERGVPVWVIGHG